MIINGEVMRIEWTEDHRPMPDDEPMMYPGAAFDDALIFKKEGDLIGTHRKLFGGIVAVVACDDGTIVEIDVDRVRIQK